VFISIYVSVKANWIGHILRRNCLLKQVIEGKIKGEIEVTRKRRRRRKKLWIALCGGTVLEEAFGPVVRQSTE
jgi:hypothetical protein